MNHHPADRRRIGFAATVDAHHIAVSFADETGLHRAPRAQESRSRKNATWNEDVVVDEYGHMRIPIHPIAVRLDAMAPHDHPWYTV